MIRFLRLTVLAAAALAAGAGARAEDAPYREASVDEVARLLGTPGARVFDANGPETYAKAHLPGATLVAYRTYEARELPADKDAPLVFYCKNTR
ncbi:rhodanese-like protein [Anaeromyxobacter dehalogenans 2CP-1]|uniref:Rhodanese-like protein n=1 Tax=Anaeromyxobacter dehalogenans (strain ATCC BAA-258 / DSM 21875 / 2CP-1) TaxID=455488 RepID=B8JAC2_ANAD2|nr:rhodanese-like domain-containing protein [Anaeromyxobacter dehalogenans]ACL65641.1 rhodanese-like protein [Anaeromyxobacter dehalogenans 2CP-1]